MLKKALILLLILPCIGTAQSKLAKYQKKVLGSAYINNQDEANKWVSVEVENNISATPYIPATESTKRNIYNLSEKGQKAYIEAINSKAKDTKSFIDALPTVLEPTPGLNGGLEIKKIDFLKKLEIDVTDEKSVLNSGRIAQLITWITLDNTSDIEFSGFNNLTTKYQSTDFGTLSINRTRGFTLNAGINLGGTGSTSSSVSNVEGGLTKTNGDTGTSSNTSNLGASYTTGKTIAEQIAIKNSTVTMKGSLSKGEVSLLQNGVPNQNLNDNINLELILKTVNNKTIPYLIFKGLFNPKNNAPVTDDTELSISKAYLTTPVKFDHDIRANLNYTYVYRHVVQGENTVIESDDKVFYYTLNNRTIFTKPFIILKQNEVNPVIYHIIYTSDGYVTPAADRLYLNYYGEHVELLFDDLHPPTDLINWIRLVTNMKKGKIKEFQFEIGKINPTTKEMSYSSFTKEEADLRLKVSLINPVN